MNRKQRFGVFFSKADLILLRRAFGYVRPHLFLFWATFLVILAGMGLELIQPLLYGQVIDHVVAKDLAMVWQTIVQVFGLVLFGGGLSLLETYLTDLLSNRIILDVKQDLYRHVLHLPMKVFDELRVGEIMSRLEGDVGVLSQIISFQSIHTIFDIFRIVGIGLIILQLNTTLSLVILVAFPLTFLTMGYFGRIFRRRGEEIKKLNDNYFSTLAESFAGIREVKALHIERKVEQKLVSWAKKLFTLQIRLDVIGGLAGFSTMILNQASSLIVLGVGGYFIIAGRLTLGTYFAFNNYAGQFRGALGRVADLNATVQQAMVSLQRIFALIDNFMLPLEERDGLVPLEVCGEIAVEKVDFGYLPDQPILRQVSFVARSGQMTALVGASGSGKTTTFHLLLRFYQPDQGRILFDGYPVNDLHLDYLREQMAIVSQEPFLFNTTILENLRLTRVDATLEEVLAAAKKAHIHHFIESLPEGYETVVGERGTRLSGGQKQRLAITRAILKGAKVLLFDEATSALDGESEEYIQVTLRELAREHTILVIAHRLSTVIHADQIIVLNEGTVAGIGKHEELMAQNPVYQRLYQSQWNSFIEKAHVLKQVGDVV